MDDGVGEVERDVAAVDAVGTSSVVRDMEERDAKEY